MVGSNSLNALHKASWQLGYMCRVRVILALFRHVQHIKQPISLLCYNLWQQYAYKYTWINSKYYKMTKRILIKWLVETVHMTRHLFCLTRNFTNDRSLVNANDWSLVKSCDKTNKHHLIKQIIHSSEGISNNYLHSAPSKQSGHPRLVRLFQRYLVWVILTNALTAVYYLSNIRVDIFLKNVSGVTFVEACW